MMTREERQKLRDAALIAANGTHGSSDLHRSALATNWRLQTSNSFRRIGSRGDGDVLCGTKHPHDAQPDLLAAPGVLDYLIAVQPRVVIQLLDAVDDLEENLEKATGLADKIEDVDRRLRIMASGLVALGDAIAVFTQATDDHELGVAGEKVRGLIAQLSTQISEVPR